MQMEARSRQTRVERQEDVDYADAVRKYVDARALEDRRREQERLRARANYRHALELQMEEASKRRMYRDVMSVHERKVNRVDLAAYENMDVSLHSKVVGTRDFAPAEKQLTPSQNETTPSPENELIRKINAPETAFRRDNRCVQKTPDCTSSSRLLAMAIKNMQDPRVDFMRHNTYNRIYGHVKESELSGHNKSFELRSPNLSLLNGREGKSWLALGGRAQISAPSKHYPSPLQTHDYAGDRLRPGKKQHVNYSSILGVNVPRP